ncbi:MAG: hypothetical protein LBP94_05420 [Zoogloeaceae bacterium]|jgi:hypothetical protein|nr:hypothetical protein [Zoogloeaceae bacterium]
MNVQRSRLWMLALLSAAALSATAAVAGASPKDMDYQRARWDPLHFSPAIETARNEDCLACHKEILDDKVRKQSPAGVKSANALAWYQTLDTYAGQQETFHWRHLQSPYANSVMQLQCNTCHQGNNPRDRAVNPPDTNFTAFTLRKNVNPDICLMCHGKYPYENMALPLPWTQMRDGLQNNCLTCHMAIRTNRHQVNFLKPEAIEALAAKEGGDVCYGCHGGRQWYRISYPYPRHAWDTMPTETPDWAQGRPQESEARFRIHPATAEKTK